MYNSKPSRDTMLAADESCDLETNNCPLNYYANSTLN